MFVPFLRKPRENWGETSETACNYKASKVVVNVSVSIPALPVTFKQKLKNVQIEEGNVAIFRCELSKAGRGVEWMKRGEEVIRGGQKYQMRQRDALLELRIVDAQPDDSSIYTCICGSVETTATLTVNGRRVRTFHSNLCYDICNDVAVSFSPPRHLQAEAKERTSGGRKRHHAAL